MAVGDSISSLRRELRRSEREMERLNREIRSTQEKVLKMQQKELEDLRQDMKRTLDQHDQEADKRYRKLLDEYNRKLQGEFDYEVQVMQKEFEDLRAEARSVQKHWEEQSMQLQEEVKNLKSRLSSNANESRKEAEKELDRLSGNLGKLREQPCEFFRKGRFGIVEDMAGQASGFLSQEYYEAAIGLAMAAGSDARRLELEIEEGRREWEKAFQEWNMSLSNLTELLEQEKVHAAAILESPVEMTKEQKRSHDILADMNFWSHGEIGRINRLAKAEWKNFKELEETGIDDALKNGSALTIEEIKKKIQKARELSKRLEEGIIYYQNVFFAYEDRCCILGEEIRMLLEEQDLQYMSDGFGTKAAKELEEEWKSYLESYGLEPNNEEEDYRSLYCMKFETNLGDQLSITILPVRKGSEVENQICYCPELKGAIMGEKYLNDLVELLKQAAGQARKKAESHLRCSVRERENAVLYLNERMPSERRGFQTDQRILETVNKINRTKLESVT